MDADNNMGHATSDTLYMNNPTLSPKNTQKNHVALLFVACKTK